MIKNKSHIEISTENRTYEFICDADSPLGEIHDSLHKMLSLVLEKMQQIHKAQMSQEENADEFVPITE